MTKNKFKILTSLSYLFLFLFLTGCGDPNGEDVPDDVRSEFFSDAVRCYYLIDNKLETNHELTGLDMDEINEFIYKYDDLSDSEMAIINGISTMADLQYDCINGTEETKYRAFGKYNVAKRHLFPYGLGELGE